MLIISALLFYVSLTMFVYHSLLLSSLVSENMTGSRIKYPFLMLRALIFRDTTKKIRSCVFRLWGTIIILAGSAFVTLAIQFGWIE